MEGVQAHRAASRARHECQVTPGTPSSRQARQGPQRKLTKSTPRYTLLPEGSGAGGGKHCRRCCDLKNVVYSAVYSRGCRPGRLVVGRCALCVPSFKRSHRGFAPCARRLGKKRGLLPRALVGANSNNRLSAMP
jgi:hypothetical protein